MSKIKIYELAKELEKPSREVIEFLAGKSIEVKSHMSSIEEAQAELVRNAFRKKEKPAEKPVEKPAEKSAEKPAEAPKKKNIVHVFRPQNTQSGARQGRRSTGKPATQMGRPMQVNNGRPSKEMMEAKALEERRRIARQQAAKKAAQEEQEAAAAKASAQEKEVQPQKPAEHPAKVENRMPEEKREAGIRPAEEKREAPVRAQEEKREAPARVREEKRETSSRPQLEGGERRGGEKRDGKNRPPRERREGERRGSDRPYAGGRDGGDRSRTGRRDGRDGGDRPYAGGRDGGRRNGERPFSSRKDGDRSEHSYSGGRDGDRSQGRGMRPGERQDRHPSIPSPIVEGQKPQRSKGKGKDDHKKKDFRHDDEGMVRGRKGRNEPKPPQMQKPQKLQAKEPKQEEKIKSIVIPEALTIQELADKMKIVPSVIVKKLFMQGKIVTVNQEIDYATAEEIALEFDVLCEKEEVVDVIEELLKEDEEDVRKMKKRPPVVCVMGHVDHGKTSLLDAIRNTNVIGREAGGITQHIGASVVEINGEKITFLDTPGHEAFTAMRMRGASSTDIAVLVVAADDGVMPQTVEAINHAKAAGIEIVVAVNKIDKPSANVERVKQELTEYELIPEDWGGSTIFVPVSAKTGEGLEELMEMILLTAEVMELKANPNRRARGLVLEAQLDKGRGSVATVLVQKGTLRIGDVVAAGSAHGKVRAMMDDKGRRVKEAGPSVPVEILGLNDVPNAGEVLIGCANDKEARNIAETFIAQSKVKLLDDTKSKLSLDDLFTQIQEGNLKELGIVVKADVQGSVEAIKQSLLKLSNDEVVIKIIHGGVGAINESDVSLASASNAIIIGFNVRPDATAKETAEREGVDVRLYRVIYNAIEDVEAAMKGMLDPVFEEKVLGHAEVRQTFKASGVGTIAGAYVQDGIFERDCSVRLVRDGIVIFEGPLASLRRFKDDVKEVRAGYECGFVFANFNDIKEGDHVEAFKMVEIPR